MIDISGKGDISQQLLRFFVDYLPADGRTIKVLKACHQKIVFPGFYHVKSKLFDRMPFKVICDRKMGGSVVYDVW